VDALIQARNNFQLWQIKLRAKKVALERGAPEVVLLMHDQWDARFVGRTSDRRQFFLTTPFVPVSQSTQGNEFVALYTFDLKGHLLEAKIDELGPRTSLDKALRKQICQRRLEELGEVSFREVGIRPFLIEREGIAFGLIPRPPADSDEEWSATIEPGNYMSFSPPWDHGRYDT
jgi:hypothetical protein